MNCGEEMNVRLSRYVDGELSPEDRAEVDAHVEGCAPCQEALALFQKNENLLTGALSSDRFGDAIVSSVMNEIHREPTPPVARPIEEGAWEALRTRPLVQLAAAALLVVGLMLLLNASHRSQMGELETELTDQKVTLETVQVTLDRTVAAHEKESRLVGAALENYETLIRDLRTDAAFAHAPGGWSLAYIEPALHHLVVKASFDPKAFTGYHVFRRLAGDPTKAFRQLTDPDKPLRVPKYVDTKAKPGQEYVYKFRALRSVGDPVDSVPIKMRLPFPGHLAPEQSIRVHCLEIAAPRDLAIFQLEKVVDGKVISQRFYAELGERVGGPRDVPGIGEVDFTTDLVLSEVREGDQGLEIRFTESLLDENGRELIERIEGGTIIPATREHDQVIHLRSNLRAILKPVGRRHGEPAADVWKGSWIRVPAPR